MSEINLHCAQATHGRSSVVCRGFVAQEESETRMTASVLIQTAFFLNFFVQEECMVKGSYSLVRMNLSDKSCAQSFTWSTRFPSGFRLK